MAQAPREATPRIPASAPAITSSPALAPAGPTTSETPWVALGQCGAAAAQEAIDRYISVVCADCCKVGGVVMTPEHLGLRCVAVPGAALTPVGSQQSGSSTQTCPESVVWPTPTAAPLNGSGWAGLPVGWGLPGTTSGFYTTPSSSSRLPVAASPSVTAGALRARRVQRVVGMAPYHHFGDDDLAMYDDNVPSSGYPRSSAGGRMSLGGSSVTSSRRRRNVQTWLDQTTPPEDVSLGFPGEIEAYPPAQGESELLGPINPHTAVKLEVFRRHLPPKMQDGWALRFVATEHETLFTAHYNRLHWLTDAAQFLWTLVTFLLLSQHVYGDKLWEAFNILSWDSVMWTRAVGVLMSLLPILATYCGGKESRTRREAIVGFLRLYVAAFTPFKIGSKRQIGDETLFNVMVTPYMRALLQLSAGVITLGFNHHTRVIRVHHSMYVAALEMGLILVELVLSGCFSDLVGTGVLRGLASLGLVVGVLGTFHYIGWRKEMWRRITWFRRNVKPMGGLAGILARRSPGGAKFAEGATKSCGSSAFSGEFLGKGMQWDAMSDGAPSMSGGCGPAGAMYGARVGTPVGHPAATCVPPPRQRPSLDRGSPVPLRVASKLDVEEGQRPNAGALAAYGRAAFVVENAGERALRQAYRYVEQSGFDLLSLVGREGRRYPPQGETDPVWAKSQYTMCVVSDSTQAQETWPALAAPTPPPRPCPPATAPAAWPVPAEAPTRGPCRLAIWNSLLLAVCTLVGCIAPGVRFGLALARTAGNVVCSVTLRILLYLCWGALCALPGRAQRYVICWIWLIRNAKLGCVYGPLPEGVPKGLDVSADTAYYCAVNQMPFVFFVDNFEQYLPHDWPPALDVLGCGRPKPRPVLREFDAPLQRRVPSICCAVA